ncbi:hypothetical protein GTY83_36885 [Streptomyces sp. SID4928]|uniref:hypothetical protein n=1 Tax=Streptomyces TaxID=1883 RepID=UPI0001C1A190|nr:MULTISPECIES: hypothetical protein [Streptomyces]MYR47578.1 hypothetical protein [Streptomyces sp. SID4928]MYR54639.1 hypothetical protein [Streptomyces sp. SID4928]
MEQSAGSTAVRARLVPEGEKISMGMAGFFSRGAPGGRNGGSVQTVPAARSPCGTR